MAITDWDGTVSHEITKVTDWDGTLSHEIAKVKDWDGTVSHLIYTFNGELLDRNNQYTEVTGGWGATMQFSALGATEAQINSDGIVFDKFGVWQKKNTLKKINVAQYSFIDIEIQCPKGMYISNGFYFGLYRELTDSHNNAVKLTPTTIDRRNENKITVTLELNGISGEYYVAMAMLAVSPHSFTITKIFLH